MEPQTFALLMEHLKEIKTQNAMQIDLLVKHNEQLIKQNEQQTKIMSDHIAEDKKVHRVVDRHSVYFSLFGLGIPALMASVAKKLGIV